MLSQLRLNSTAFNSSLLLMPSIATKLGSCNGRGGFCRSGTAVVKISTSARKHQPVFRSDAGIMYHGAAKNGPLLVAPNSSFLLPSRICSPKKNLDETSTTTNTFPFLDYYPWKMGFGVQNNRMQRQQHGTSGLCSITAVNVNTTLIPQDLSFRLHSSIEQTTPYKEQQEQQKQQAILLDDGSITATGCVSSIHHLFPNMLHLVMFVPQKMSDDCTDQNVVQMSSTLKKRRAKIRKHKLRKRRKLERRKSH